MSQLAFTFPTQPDPKTIARNAREAASVKPVFTYVEGARIRLNHSATSSVDWGAMASETAITGTTDDDMLFASR